MVLRLMVKKTVGLLKAPDLSLDLSTPTGLLTGETANRVAVPAFKVEPLNDRLTRLHLGRSKEPSRGGQDEGHSASAKAMRSEMRKRD